MFKPLGGITKAVCWAFLAAAIAGMGFGQEATVQIARKNSVGSYLTDAQGRTLYLFKMDSQGRSSCAGLCAERWPLFYSENIAVPSSLNVKDFGTIAREDGKKQTTYKGMALYYYFKDAKAGDTIGHGMNHVWYAVNP